MPFCNFVGTGRLQGAAMKHPELETHGAGIYVIPCPYSMKFVCHLSRAVTENSYDLRVHYLIHKTKIKILYNY